MDSLRIYLVSYNVACKPPEESLDELLGLEEPEEKLPDLYAIGLQEVKAQVYNMIMDALLDDPWTIAFKQELEVTTDSLETMVQHLTAAGSLVRDAIGMKLKTKNFVKLKTVRLQGLILSIYAKRKHLLNIRDVEVQYTKTGFAGLWGNKGGVAIRVNVYGVSVCLVNTHLTPHDQNLQARVQDYNTIVSETNFARQKETGLIFYHDYVFWIGDHNFRIDEAIPHEEILEKIKANKLDCLMNLDQLKCIMRSGQAFSELIEEPFHFAPTYKYIFKSSEYDPKRRPAWTDRILYRVNTNAYENLTLSAKMEFYKSFPSYMVSDHKPIAGGFSFKIFSDYSDHIVDFSPIKKWHINEENIVFFTANDIQISDWDWIGVYKYNFCALDEYVSFVYVNTISSTWHDLSRSHALLDASSSANSSRWKEIKFPDGMVRTEGKYCLLYLTADSGSVLGISSVFEAEFKTGSDSSTCVSGSSLDKFENSIKHPGVTPRRSPVRLKGNATNSGRQEMKNVPSNQQ